MARATLRRLLEELLARLESLEEAVFGDAEEEEAEEEEEEE